MPWRDHGNDVRIIHEPARVAGNLLSAERGAGCQPESSLVDSPASLIACSSVDALGGSVRICAIIIIHPSKMCADLARILVSMFACNMNLLGELACAAVAREACAPYA